MYSIIQDIKLNKNLQSTILLSPAAASFDQFSNFESRGIYFKNLIKHKNIKFVKKFLNLKKFINLGLKKFVFEVRTKKYPSKKHSY